MTRPRLGMLRASIVLLLAVSVALVGTATVGNAAGALTKGAVKKIAKKQATKVVAQLAPSLSVANAGTLAGSAPAAFQDRVAFVENDGTFYSAAVYTEFLKVDISVPAGVHFVKATGVTAISGPNGTVSLFVQGDSACNGPGAGSDFRTFVNPNGTYASAVDQQVFAVTPGTHTYRLCGFSASDAAFTANPSLTVETLAAGATGGPTITRPTPGGPSPDGAPAR